MRILAIIHSIRQRGRLSRHPQTGAHARDFRIALLLTIIFVLSLFDLGYTQAQLPRGNFAESNFIAAGVVTQGAGHTAAYKLLLLSTGVLLLYRCRTSWTAEIAAWGLLAVHVGLIVWWTSYMAALEICLTDVAIAPVRPL